MELETGVCEMKLGITGETLLSGSPPNFIVVLPIYEHNRHSKAPVWLSTHSTETSEYYQQTVYLPTTSTWPHRSTRQNFQPRRANFEYRNNKRINPGKLQRRIELDNFPKLPKKKPINPLSRKLQISQRSWNQNPEANLSWKSRKKKKNPEVVRLWW